MLDSSPKERTNKTANIANSGPEKHFTIPTGEDSVVNTSLASERVVDKLPLFTAEELSSIQNSRIQSNTLAYTKLVETSRHLAGHGPAEVAEYIIRLVDSLETKDLESIGFGCQILAEELLKTQLPSIDQQQVQVNRLPLSYQKNRNEFLSTIIDFFNSDTYGQDQSHLSKLADKTELLLFSDSPNMTDYVGSLEEVINLAIECEKKSALPRVAWELREQVMQAITFTNGEKNTKAILDLLEAKINPSDIPRTLNFLKFCDYISEHATAVDFGKQASTIIQEIYNAAINSGQPLIEIVARSYQANLYKWNTVEPTPTDNWIQTGDSTNPNFIAEQDALPYYLKLPEYLNGGFRLNKISKDFYGLLNRYNLISMVAGGGEKVPQINLAVSVLAQLATNVGRYNREVLEDPAVRDWASAVIGHEKYQEIITSVNPYEKIAIEISNIVGEKLALEPIDFITYITQQNFRQSPEVLGRLYQELNRPQIRIELERILAVDFGSISLNAQLLFIDYISQADEANFYELVQTMRSIPDFDRPKFLESFLALEMGEEFGLALQNIAKHLPEDKLSRLLSSMEMLRTGAETMREMFADSAPEFAKQANHALVLRCTEMLAVLDELSAHGSANRKYELNGREVILTVDTVDEVIDAFEMLGIVFANLSHRLRLDFLDPDTPIKRWDAEEISEGLFLLQSSSATRAQSLTMSRPVPGYDTKILLRPLGVAYENRDEAYEYNGQARINLLVNLEFTTEVNGSHDDNLLVTSEARKNYLSIRFDRESFEYDDQGRPLPETDNPESESGRISLDLGSIADPPGNPNFEIAKILALGNLILSEKRGVLAQLNHVRETFDASYGDREVFAQIVNDLILRLTNPKKWLEQRQSNS